MIFHPVHTDGIAGQKSTGAGYENISQHSLRARLHFLVIAAALLGSPLERNRPPWKVEIATIATRF
jgi:hypothetical protein